MLVAPTGVVLQRLIVCLALEQHRRFVLMTDNVVHLHMIKSLFLFGYKIMIIF